ncbi:M10 family metallopeptidase C-terminal domain-containing protein [Inquilinus limosus]|uniref:M10 family metallopeptidase C-terminal domain-containing protein n=1 Tax=Inquilinus limosus TaxID=171674 RepID=UPI003F137D4A
MIMLRYRPDMATTDLLNDSVEGGRSGAAAIVRGEWPRVTWPSEGLGLAVVEPCPEDGANATGIRVGTESNDVLFGDTGADTLQGRGGADLLHGDGGADQLDGGAGEDTVSYFGSAWGVTVDLRTGRGRGSDAEGDRYQDIEHVLGSSHDDVLIGDEGINRLSGDVGNDRLLGEGGADVLDGGTGWDKVDYSGSAGRVAIDLSGTPGSGGTAEGDVLIGIEEVVGSGYDDRITGDGTDNRLCGGAGDDRIDGGVGRDLLMGGTGADRFVYTAVGDSGLGSADADDVIEDFSQADGDTIDLSAIDTDPVTPGDQGFMFLDHRGRSFTGTPGEVRFDYTRKYEWTRIYVDVDGDRETDMLISLKGHVDLTTDDFVL